MGGGELKLGMGRLPYSKFHFGCWHFSPSYSAIPFLEKLSVRSIFFFFWYAPVLLGAALLWDFGVPWNPMYLHVRYYRYSFPEIYFLPTSIIEGYQFSYFQCYSSTLLLGLLSENKSGCFFDYFIHFWNSHL